MIKKNDKRHTFRIYPAKNQEVKMISDAGLKSSNGKKIESPKFFRKSEDKLAWEQRKLSRKKKC